ncbi:MAG: acetate--CoA ligase family protein [Deltaproteobacteria bacterium]|nr:acetate--CoA ligase family protein [Deltaproteobacteria bacterium]
MSVDSILKAKSVAVVGASKVETKRGFQAIRTLLAEGYSGKIFPVNPKEESILGFRCYPKVSAIEEDVELALITTPAQTVPSVLEDCGKKGVRGAVIIAGGFGETGAEGKSREEAAREAARKCGIRFIGPNTSGIMNLHENLNLVGLRDAPKGDIALLTQSGNMALTLITEAKLKSRKGFSYYVGVGNETDLKFHEYLEFFRNDPNTRAILMYVEGMRQGRAFLQEAYKTTPVKPIILLKGGRSATGKRSAGSHTGALAGMSEVAKGAFERAGVVVIENPDELFPAAETLSSLPAIKTNSVAILADGGGHATIVSDLLTDLGVQIPPLEEKTQKKLKTLLPAAASVPNPVDVAGGTDADPEIFAKCARIILNDRNIGGLLIVGLFGGYGIRFAESLSLIEEDAAHQMGKMVSRYKKPIVVHSLFSSMKPHALDLLRYYGVPVYDSLDVACKCVAVLARYGGYVKSHPHRVSFAFNWGQKAKKRARKIIEGALKEDRRILLEHNAKQILRLHGAPVPDDTLAKTADDAVAIAQKINGKVALKIVSPDVLHKSDAGGVRINLETEEEIRNAFAEIITNVRDYDPDADIRGILVSPMAKPGLEVIVGTKIDDQFGPIILFGLGGVMVEILKDVAFRVLPISPRGAKLMIDELKSSPLLDGFRGSSPLDKEALRKLLLTVSEIIESYPEIEEMDLNPVLVHEQGHGVSIVDARIILKAPEENISSLPADRVVFGKG